MEDDRTGLYAIDVSRLSRDELNWEHVRSGINLDQLPKIFVPSPLSFTNEAAVLSWRWDRNQYSGRSRNVALALMHARELGLRFLFFDYASVDQSLTRAKLLQDVVQFGRLYIDIPVIAAYDEAGKDSQQFQLTLRRPWILHELRQTSMNPTNVTHVGFQSSSLTRRELSFENEIWLVRKSGFAKVIYDLLHGMVEMTSVEDLALILPEFEPVFASAFRTMSRNDYLLTTFLLAAYYQPGQQIENGTDTMDYGLRIDYHSTCFDKEEFTRYTLGPGGSTSRSFEWRQDILFDGKPVAVLRTKMTSSYDRNWVEVLPSGESHILGALELTEEARSRFDERHAERRASLFVDQTAPGPMVNERLASVQKERWIDVPDPAGTSLGFAPRKTIAHKIRHSRALSKTHKKRTSRWT